MRGARAEVRWFVAGDLPADRRPAGSVRRRQDAYNLTNLTPATSVKRRGRRGRTEWKLRVGRVELVQLGAVAGFAERWVKFLGEPPEEPLPGDRWLDVRKDVWTDGRLELARLEVAGERWWTVALADADHAGASRLLAPWSEWLEAIATPGSYPSWLLGVVARLPAERLRGARSG
jgi:hypothetical protein